MIYILKVKEDKKTKNLFIKFPAKLMKKMNWKIGDPLKWEVQKDGSFSLKKISQTNTVTKGAIKTHEVNYRYEQ